MCTGPLGAKGPQTLERDLAFLKEAAEGKVPRSCSCASSRPAGCRSLIWNEHYGSEEEFVFALAEAVKPYYKAIVDAGMILQIDSPGHRRHLDMGSLE